MFNDFIKGFRDLIDLHWMNWIDLIYHKCGGKNFSFDDYEEKLEFNRREFFNCISGK